MNAYPTDGDALAALAAEAGVSVHWEDAEGRPQTVAPETLRAVLEALGWPCNTPAQAETSRAALHAMAHEQVLPPLWIARGSERLTVDVPLEWHGRAYRLVSEEGEQMGGVVAREANGAWHLPRIYAPGYYRLEVADAHATLAVCPARCYGLADALGGEERRAWGLAAQVYGLRRAGDGGLGDFAAVGQWARAAAAEGADALMLSPTHALFAADPGRFSPYSPSSREWLNALHADPAAVFGEDGVRAAICAEGLEDTWSALEREPLIDWPRAARARLAVLRRLFRHVEGDPGSLPAVDFGRFRHAAGASLEAHAMFETLHCLALHTPGHAWHWRDWPAHLRDPQSARAHAFVNAHREEIDFHIFLQWLAARSADAAQRVARAAGMGVGLVADVAVGADTGGSEVWCRQREMLTGVSLGAPPDRINAQGQSWGLAALSPWGLRANGYAGFLAPLRGAMRHAGGVRIDHVLGLMRMWLIPRGAPALEGAYLRYPMHELMSLLALESWRHRCVVIGEDLGTVPRGFRDHLEEAGILGLRVLPFEYGHPPHAWTRHAVAATTTHDLPTTPGWWSGRDIALRAEVGWCDAAATRAAEEERQRERHALWSAFGAAGVAHGAPPAPTAEAAPVREAVAFIARTPCVLALLPIEDALGLAEQPNLPGTIDQHPNWRRRLPVEAPAAFADPALRARIAPLAERAPARVRLGEAPRDESQA